MQETRRLYWDGDGIVLHARRPPTRRNRRLGLHGIDIPWPELMAVEAVDPWPRVRVTFRSRSWRSDPDQTATVGPEPAAPLRAERRFAAHVEAFLAEVARRHPRRLRPGWERFPKVAWSPVRRLPGDGSSTGPPLGAYRGGLDSRPVETVDARYRGSRRPDRVPGALVTGGLTAAIAGGLAATQASWPVLVVFTVTGLSLGAVGLAGDWLAGDGADDEPRVLVAPLVELTRDHVYARGRDGRGWRVPRNTVRAHVPGRVDDEDRFVFGRAAELRLPASAGGDVRRGLLDTLAGQS